ncbi:MAG: GtrA family protein [Dysgonamonadaceae bacterium]|jgi:putative flippase GtrA|nr:GtrA family protein [Dysgonamonadaceae bacterium]
MRNSFLIQSIKYGIVGVINTLITLTVIGLMLHFIFGISGTAKATTFENTVSNIAGYAAGLINSFVFNRKWTFHSKARWQSEFIRFMSVFLICYVSQLLLLILLNNSISLTSVKILNYSINYSFVCQIIGNVFYTVLNFILNKYFTFKNSTPRPL